MRSSVLLSALCAAGVMGSPVQKRAYKTELTIVTVTEYVTPGFVAPTPAISKVDAAPEAEGFYVTTLYYTRTEAPTPVIEPFMPWLQPAPAETKAPAPVHAPAYTAQPAPAETQAPSPTPEPVTTSEPATTAAPAPAVTSRAPTLSNSDNSYQAQVLQNHNIHRANHSAPALSWSTTLEASAKKLADSCVYEHNTEIDGGGYGQNIGYGIPADDIGKMITNLMYNDEFGYFESLYGQATPDMTDFEKWGHFSQIVWKGTTQVGCATTVCDTLQNVGSGSIPFTVCNYGPPGNVDGEYAENVARPLGQPFFAVA